MLTLRASKERGGADHGWLQSHHTFSFADYYDPDHMAFRSLRVINEDFVAGGEGFGMHPHQHMEIITYMVSGALTHRDSLGSEATIRPGQFQYMSAGTGVRHSEFNASKTETAHLLQIWIMPNVRGTKPTYQDTDLTAEFAKNGLVLAASPDGRNGSFAIHADAFVYASQPKAGASLSLPLVAGRGAWIQLIAGSIDVNGRVLTAGDAVAVEGEPAVNIAVKSDANFLLFDLA